MPATAVIETQPSTNPRLLLAGLLTCIATAAAPFPSLGHDFWIQPATHRPDVNQPLFLWLKVGDPFRGANVAYLEPRVERFSVYGSDGSEIPAVPLETKDPAGLVRLTSPGTYEVAYLGRPQEHVLGGPRFESYLREEGLLEISRLREQNGETDRTAREQFMRCAKAELRVRSESTPTSTSHLGGLSGSIDPIGLPLELLATRDGGQSEPEAYAVRLLFQGQPLSDALVVAIPESAPQARLEGRTDDDGRILLRLERGVWMIKSVHMEAAPEGSSADYFSWWASLTLEVDPPDHFILPAQSVGHSMN
ncbi:MAG: DUF4198 domain-containing protein [Thermoanaerobaculia bacterium]|nr:DUF4198 domain-containing protein [Thermoanaerobaculia bacterium]